MEVAAPGGVILDVGTLPGGAAAVVAATAVTATAARSNDRSRRDTEESPHECWSAPHLGRSTVACAPIDFGARRRLVNRTWGPMPRSKNGQIVVVRLAYATLRTVDDRRRLALMPVGPSAISADPSTGQPAAGREAAAGP